MICREMNDLMISTSERWAQTEGQAEHLTKCALKALVIPTGEVIVKGTFRYQACDDRKCYVPEAVPLEWRFKYEGLDRARAPSDLQHKPN